MTDTSLPLMPPRPASAPNRRPALTLLASEPARATLEAVQALGHWLRAPEPVGQGHPVVLFPGLGTDGVTLWPLRRHLERAGFRAIDWGQGLNTGPRGDVDAWLDGLAEAVHDRIAPAHDVSFVGWSLGGFYARELAKRWPERVHHVITIGTPFNGSADDTHVGWLFRLLNGQHAPKEAALRERLAEPPPVPTISLYSRRDGIVSWEACTHDRRWPLARDIEVDASHLGMGWAPEVLSRVTQLLACRRRGAE
ncbi:alpha/beta hydrolase [Roseateles cellulosilyticus]|uniref:Alpha/beta hydrolase n=1 Tax=Pelomonas cellulosilytica TaxID=2906762 RepID=A0ABS8XXA0_9BURK|nr:alpha/beta hydrolase [Pelomonas sp. P8]MCE4555406.1 alpha/beta hydrolase [Pelomonas sp. P8]